MLGAGNSCTRKMQVLCNSPLPFPFLDFFFLHEHIFYFVLKPIFLQFRTYDMTLDWFLGFFPIGPFIELFPWGQGR